MMGDPGITTVSYPREGPLVAYYAPRSLTL